MGKSTNLFDTNYLIYIARLNIYDSNYSRIDSTVDYVNDIIIINSYIVNFVILSRDCRRKIYFSY